MVLMIGILMSFCFDTHCDILIVNCFALMKAQTVIIRW